MEADAEMNRDVDRVIEHTSSVDDGLALHASMVSQATDPVVVAAMETAHYDSMGEHITELDRTVADMGTYCMGERMTARGRTHDMETAMTEMGNERERHRAAPRVDVVGARAEEERHVRDLRAILVSMRTTGEAMRHDAGLYRCQHGDH
jgi:hypothetical protein